MKHLNILARSSHTLKFQGNSKPFLEFQCESKDSVCTAAEWCRSRVTQISNRL